MTTRVLHPDFSDLAINDRQVILLLGSAWQYRMHCMGGVRDDIASHIAAIADILVSSALDDGSVAAAERMRERVLVLSEAIARLHDDIEWQIAERKHAYYEQQERLALVERDAHDLHMATHHAVLACRGA